ncbi:MAG: glycosyltransferase, partial [Nanoarchaeota archaeon]
MIFSVIISNYNSAEYIDLFFKTWIEYKEKHSKNPIIFSVIDTKFIGNLDNNLDNWSDDGSLELLQEYRNKGIIKYLRTSENPLLETEARNLALKSLLEEESPEWVLSTAFDERIQFEEIEKLINYINKEKFIDCFSINYKNLVFTKNKWIEGFCPRRVWKVNCSNNYKLMGFYEDDGCFYENLEGIML